MTIMMLMTPSTLQMVCVLMAADLSSRKPGSVKDVLALGVPSLQISASTVAIKVTGPMNVRDPPEAGVEEEGHILPGDAPDLGRQAQILEIDVIDQEGIENTREGTHPVLLGLGRKALVEAVVSLRIKKKLHPREVR